MTESDSFYTPNETGLHKAPFLRPLAYLAAPGKLARRRFMRLLMRLLPARLRQNE